MLSKERAIFFRFVSALLVVCLALSLPLPAYSLSANEGIVSLLDPASLPIPEDLGKIEESYKGSSGKLVIYIQDAHTNYSAQKNIAAIINKLVADHGIHLVTVEAAQGDIETELFRSFPIPEVSERVMDRFMRKGEIGGPQYASITGKTPFEFVGIDKSELYKDNLSQFLAVLGDRESGLSFIRKAELGMTQLKTVLYSKEARELDRLLETHTSQFTDLLSFLNRLRAKADELGEPLDDYAHLNKLMEYSEQLKNGEMAEGKVREEFKTVDAIVLFNEIEHLSFELKYRLAQSEEARRLIRLERYLTLLKHGFSLELTREDGARLKGMQKDFMQDKIVSFMESVSAQYKLDTSYLEEMRSVPLDDYITQIFRFYEGAEEREREFEKRLKREMLVRFEQSAVLVTGGYHREGMLKRLRAANISYAVITPVIDGLTDHEKYLDLMRESGQLLSLVPGTNNIALAVANYSFGELSTNRMAAMLSAPYREVTQTELEVAAISFGISLDAGNLRPEIFRIQTRNTAIVVGDRVVGFGALNPILTNVVHQGGDVPSKQRKLFSALSRVAIPAPIAGFGAKEIAEQTAIPSGSSENIRVLSVVDVDLIDQVVAIGEDLMRRNPTHFYRDYEFTRDDYAQVLLDDMETGLSQVYMEDGKVIGFLLAAPLEVQYEEGKFPYLYFIGIAFEHQGKGINKILEHEFSKKVLASQSVERHHVYAATQDSNVRMRAIFKKLGYERLRAFTTYGSNFHHYRVRTEDLLKNTGFGSDGVSGFEVSFAPPSGFGAGMGMAQAIEQIRELAYELPDEIAPGVRLTVEKGQMARIGDELDIPGLRERGAATIIQGIRKALIQKLKTHPNRQGAAVVARLNRIAIALDRSGSNAVFEESFDMQEFIDSLLYASWTAQYADGNVSRDVYPMIRELTPGQREAIAEELNARRSHTTDPMDLINIQLAEHNLQSALTAGFGAEGKVFLSERGVTQANAFEILEKFSKQLIYDEKLIDPGIPEFGKRTFSFYPLNKQKSLSVVVQVQHPGFSTSSAPDSEQSLMDFVARESNASETYDLFVYQMNKEQVMVEILPASEAAKMAKGESMLSQVNNRRGKIADAWPANNFAIKILEENLQKRPWLMQHPLFNYDAVKQAIVNWVSVTETQGVGQTVDALAREVLGRIQEKMPALINIAQAGLQNAMRAGFGGSTNITTILVTDVENFRAYVELAKTAGFGALTERVTEIIPLRSAPNVAYLQEIRTLAREIAPKATVVGFGIENTLRQIQGNRSVALAGDPAALTEEEANMLNIVPERFRLHISVQRKLSEYLTLASNALKAVLTAA